MADKLPLEIQLQIFKNLNVKSLIRFRSVSKSCKSVIDSSAFIQHYIGQQHHLLVRYRDAVSLEDKYVSIVDDDDDTFPKHKAIPQLVDDDDVTTIGSSHGLLCLFRENQPKAVIWNPYIRKSVPVVVPRVKTDRIVLGFGVCRDTTDPKIVKISYRNWWRDMESVAWQVEVFALSARVWRRPYSTNLPRRSIYVHWDQVVVDGCLYWLARDGITEGDGRYKYIYLIISFDMTTEEFGEVKFPDSLAHLHFNLSMYKLRESLIVIDTCIEDYNIAHHVWMMEDGVVPKSFKKLYTVNKKNSLGVSINRVVGFRKTGEPLVELQSHDGLTGTRTLAAYEPYSKSISSVGINGRHCSYSAYSYMETLLLLSF